MRFFTDYKGNFVNIAFVTYIYIDGSEIHACTATHEEDICLYVGCSNEDAREELADVMKQIKGGE